MNEPTGRPVERAAIAAAAVGLLVLAWVLIDSLVGRFAATILIGVSAPVVVVLVSKRRT